MQSTDFEHFRARMRAMARLFNAELDAGVLDLYWLCLRDWTPQEFDAAVVHLMGNAQFMPKPVDFTALRRKAGEQTVGEAWAKVRAKLMHVGAHDRVSIDVRTDRVVAAMGGYLRLAQTNTADMPFRENRFRELWEELGEAEEARMALPSVAKRISGPEGAGAALARIGGRW